ncbi:MAG: DUF6452 family protein [Bacteroidaceae bacterium]|jgi:hypothetical protein
MTTKNRQGKWKKVLALFLIAPALFLATQACDEDSDTSLPRTTCGVYFYDLDAGRQTVDSLTVAALTEHGDSVLYHMYSGENISLPLRYIGDSTQFSIQQGDHMPDTLTVVHKNTPSFVSLDAGYVMNYEILRVRTTRHAIEDITVVSTSITTYEQENLAITYP